MARTSITVTDAPGRWATSGTAVTFEAADTANQNRVKLTGSGTHAAELVIAENTDASSHNVTITSVNDPYNRTGNISSETITAGQKRVYGPFPTKGWQQSDGYLYFEADNANVEFAVIRLP